MPSCLCRALSTDEVATLKIKFPAFDHFHRSLKPFTIRTRSTISNYGKNMRLLNGRSDGKLGLSKNDVNQDYV